MVDAIGGGEGRGVEYFFQNFFPLFFLIILMLCFSISSASLGKKKQTKEKADVTEDEEEGKKDVPIRKNRSKGRYVFFFKIKPKRLQFSFVIARLPQIYSPYMTIYGL